MRYCCAGRFDAAVNRSCRKWYCAGGVFDDDNANDVEQEKGGRNKVKRFDLRCMVMERSCFEFLVKIEDVLIMILFSFMCVRFE